MRSFLLLLSFIFLLPLHAQRSDFNEIAFAKAENTADQYKGEALSNLPVLAHQLTAHLATDVERFRAIYYWVCHNISGDYDLMTKNDRKRHKLRNDPKGLRDWNYQFKKEVFKRLLDDNETLCSGYAYLIRELCALAGLECEIIYGFGNEVKLDADTPNHSWNAVRLNGKWYLCDATWSSGFTDMSTFMFTFEYDDRFFLMEPLEFAKSHTPVDKKWALLY